MPIVRAYSRSFASGEVTSELLGRLDNTKRQEALTLCRNAVTRPHGPVVNRTGTEYVSQVKTYAPTRLIPFNYRNQQAYAIEVGAGYFRFHFQAATVLAQATAWNSATSYLPEDMVTYGGVTYSCLTANTNVTPTAGVIWRLTAWTVLNVYKAGNLVTYGGNTYYATAAIAAGVTPGTGAWYQLPANGYYEIPNSYASADLFNIHYTQSADVLTLVHPNYPPAELRRYGGINWVLSNISFLPPFSTATGPTLSATVANSVTNWNTYNYAITAIQASNGEESSLASSALNNLPGMFTVAQAVSGVSGSTVTLTSMPSPAFIVGDMVYFTQLAGTLVPSVVQGFVASVSGTNITINTLGGNLVTFTGSGTGTLYLCGVKNDLSISGNKNTITWTDSSPAGTWTQYYVYRWYQGVWAFVGSTVNTTFTDQNIIPNTAITPPNIDTTTMNSAGNYPQAVTYFQQRRVFGGTTNQPQNIWATKTGTESSLGYAIPVQATDRIAVRIAAREASGIQHFVSVANLIVLTASNEWQINGGQAYAALTPTSFQVQPQAYVGANNVTPVTVGNTILYGAARGGHIREMSYAWQFQGYVSNDISLLAPHLFDYSSIVDMAYCRGPLPMLVCVSSNGSLLTMTYVPEQQVAAWHHQDTGASGADIFESCCTVVENNEDMIYLIVNRNINGTRTRFVERWHTRNFNNNVVNWFGVDCGISQTFGSPVTSVTGLTWLANMPVSVLADGNVVSGLTVSNTGTLTLPQPASVVTVGLPYTTQIQTPPVAAQTDPALGQGRVKNVNRVWIRSTYSSGINVGPDFGRLATYAQRTSEPLGTAPNMVTDEIEIFLYGEWGSGGQVCIQQTDPLPIDIVDLTLEVQVGGG